MLRMRKVHVHALPNVWPFLFSYFSRASMTPNFKYRKNIFTQSRPKEVVGLLHTKQPKCSNFFTSQHECTIVVQGEADVG